MKQTFTTCILVLCLFIGFSAKAKIYYVKPIAIGNGSGDDWNNASSNIQAMINLATVGDQIWVATGTYKPAVQLPGGATARDASFLLKDGVAIYGGFFGNENILSERNFVANPTILSGDIGTENDITDNVYHVVVSVGNTNDARLDGFTISGGYANGTGSFAVATLTVTRASGGGVYLNASSPVLDNLIIKDNECYGTGSNGGGIYATAGGAAVISNTTISNNKSGAPSGSNGTSGAIWLSGAAVQNTMKLTNVLISGNSARLAGAIYVQNNSAPEFINVRFINNASTTTGGAVYVAGGTTYTSAPIFESCEFSGNSAGSSGGAVYISNYANTQFTDVVFTNNIATTGSGGAINIVGNSSISAIPNEISITGGSFSGNSCAGSGGAAYISTNTKANIKNVLFSGNTGSAAGGALFLFSDGDANATNVTILNSIFYNNEAKGASTSSVFGGGGVASSTNTNSLIKNCTFYSNKATFRNGGALAIVATAKSVVVANCIMYGNTAPGVGAANPDISDGSSNPSVLDLKYSLTQEIGTSGVNGMEVGADPFFLSTNPLAPNFLQLNPITDSPVIDLGDNGSITGLLTDFAGNPRIYKGRVDMGAYEYQGTLPVDLTSFTAKKTGTSSVLISWITVSETDNDHFLIERSKDAVHYTALTKVLPKGNGKGMQRYGYTDYAPINGVNYYRLIQVDINGVKKIYDSQSVNISLHTGTIANVYPNPVKNHKLTVEVIAKSNTKTRLTDISGKELEKFDIKANSSPLIVDFSKYAAGIYFLHISNADGNNEVKKIINP